MWKRKGGTAKTKSIFREAGEGVRIKKGFKNQDIKAARDFKTGWMRGCKLRKYSPGKGEADFEAQRQKKAEGLDKRRKERTWRETGGLRGRQENCGGIKRTEKFRQIGKGDPGGPAYKLELRYIRQTK